MALVKCKECGHQISTNARNCAHCGAKSPMAMHSKIIWGSFFAIFFIGIFIAGTSTPPLNTDNPALELTSLECIPGNAMIIVTGSVKNVSGKRMAGVSAIVSFYAKDGAFVKREQTLIDLQPLMPDQKSSFSMMRQGNPAISDCVVQFNEGFTSVSHTVASK